MNETNKTEKTKKRGAARAFDRRGRPAALFASALFLLLAGAFFLAPAASAAGPVTLPMKQTFVIAGASSGAPDGTFLYRLTPAADAPALADDGVFYMTGTEERSIAIPFAADVAPGGPYGYTLRCEMPARSYYTLDGQVYRVNVYVLDGSRTGVNVYYEEEYAEKGNASLKVPDSVSFTHAYNYVPPGGGGDNGGGDNGDGDDGDGDDDGEDDGDGDDGGEDNGGETGGTERPDPPAPSNGGSLIPGENGNYIEIDENGVPIGEWHWDDDEGQWIFDKYPPLAQTGQLRWPVPVLGVSGALLFFLGLFLNKRRERNGSRTVRAKLDAHAGE
jgi:hypothetical protein